VSTSGATCAKLLSALPTITSSPELNSSHYLQNSFQATQLLTHAQHRLSAAKHYTTLTESKNTSIKHQYVGILACQIQQCRAESCINSYLIISHVWTYSGHTEKIKSLMHFWQKTLLARWIVWFTNCG